MNDLVGQQVDHYTLIKSLGGGTFGSAYLAKDTLRNTNVVIKILHTKGSLQDFLLEVRTLLRLKGKPGIVDILDFSTSEETPRYIVMSYAEKGSLRSQHPRGTQLSLETIVLYTKQIAAALQEAHTIKLVHRDIKPDNILVGRDGNILVSDFGIATESASFIHKGQEAAGTIKYIAPEQADGRAVSASDQYSLAVMVFEWYCGVTPIDAAISVIAQTLPVALYIVLNRALEKDPTKRYPCILDFADALEQAAAQISKDVSEFPPSQLLLPPRGAIIRTIDITALKNIRDASVIIKWFGGEICVETEYSLSFFDAYTGEFISEQVYRKPQLVDIRSKFYENEDMPIDQKPRILKLVNDVAEVWNFDDFHSSEPKLPLVTYTAHQHIDSAAWSPDGKYIATVGGNFVYDGVKKFQLSYKVHIWEAQTGDCVYCWPDERVTRKPIYSVAWSPDGTHIATVHKDAIKIWKAI